MAQAQAQVSAEELQKELTLLRQRVAAFVQGEVRTFYKRTGIFPDILVEKIGTRDYPSAIFQMKEQEPVLDVTTKVVVELRGD